MAAATVTDKLYEQNIPAQPGVECVVLTVSDGETYTAQNLSVIKGAQLTWAENDASTNAPTYSVSGKVLTVHAASVSDKKCMVTLYGRP